MAESILSQLINKSAGDLANDAPRRDLKRRATAPGKVSAAPRLVLSPRCSCSVQAHCEFGAAAAALAPFPSAAAPLQNRLWCKQLPGNAHFIPLLGWEKEHKGSEVGAQIRSLMLVRSGSCPGLASGRPPVQTAPTALLVPPEVRERRNQEMWDWLLSLTAQDGHGRTRG